MTRVFIFLVVAALVVLTCASALLYFSQRKLLYYPEVESEELLLRKAESGGLEEWRGDDGTLIGWKTSNSSAPDRALIFHGNAGNAVARAPLTRQLRAACEKNDMQIWILEYPGYGARQGEPCESEFVAAALDAYKTLRENFAGRVLLVGESIGSGVACQVAGLASPAPDGLLLITPFDSLVSVAGFHYPYLPVGLLLRDRFDSVSALNGFEGRVGILLAAEDKIIPARFGERLAETLPDELSMTMEISDAGHNDILSLAPPVVLSRLLQFVLPQNGRQRR